MPWQEQRLRGSAAHLGTIRLSCSARCLLLVRSTALPLPLLTCTASLAGALAP
jgi:hypothetical protein